MKASKKPQAQTIKFKDTPINLLRETAQDEYGHEHERTATIDAKAGIALPIIVAYFLALAQINNFTAIVEIDVHSLSQAIVPMVTLATYTISLVTAILAVIWMGRVVLTRDYSRINPKDLYSEDYLKKDSRVLSVKLLLLYFEAIENNRSANNKRAKLYQRGWLFSLISISCFVVYIIVKNNFYQT